MYLLFFCHRLSAKTHYRRRNRKSPVKRSHEGALRQVKLKLLLYRKFKVHTLVARCGRTKVAASVTPAKKNNFCCYYVSLINPNAVHVALLSGFKSSDTINGYLHYILLNAASFSIYFRLHSFIRYVCTLVSVYNTMYVCVSTMDGLVEVAGLWSSSLLY